MILMLTTNVIYDQCLYPAWLPYCLYQTEYTFAYIWSIVSMYNNPIIISVKLSNRSVYMKAQCENMRNSY